MEGKIGLDELFVLLVLLVAPLVLPLLFTWSVKSIMREYFKLRSELAEKK
jgi:hypothetical protein